MSKTSTSSKHVFIVTRIIRFQLGTQVSFPVQAFQKKRDADEVAAKLESAIENMLDKIMCVRAPEGGVKLLDQTVESLLTSIGIVGVEHKVMEMGIKQGVATIHLINEAAIHNKPEPPDAS